MCVNASNVKQTADANITPCAALHVLASCGTKPGGLSSSASAIAAERAGKCLLAFVRVSYDALTRQISLARAPGPFETARRTARRAATASVAAARHRTCVRVHLLSQP
jgi:hypothetical protein